MQGSERARRPYGALTASEKRALVTAREAEFLKNRQKVRDADLAKTARLRALRLAKQAADRDAAAAVQKRTAEKPNIKARQKPL
jgi:hypothetical protein